MGLSVTTRSMPTNSAFVFIKPHAVTDKVKELTGNVLTKNNIKILEQGEIKSEEIDSKKLIDQHYYAIASKATILKPNQLNVPEDKFKEKFGLEWKQALENGNVYNALDACAKLEVTPDEMDAQWGICKKTDKLIKFGGGFYCGLVEIEGKPSIYAFNGFFMSMRNKFTAPGLSIYYYSVEWDSDALSWADFRGKVLGPTDPTEAPEDSGRGMILASNPNPTLATTVCTRRPRLLRRLRSGTTGSARPSPRTRTARSSLRQAYPRPHSRSGRSTRR